MPMRRLRPWLLGIAAATPGFAAQADSIYMLSRADGSIYFGRQAGSPRYAERARAVAKRLPVGSGLYGFARHGCSDSGCDASRFDQLIDEVATGYGLESALLHAVVAVESRYDPRALSPMGAAGLMQLMPGTARRYGVEDVLDPEQNLRGGARYLRDLLARFGSDIRLALAAYHVGEGNVIRYRNSVPPFQATIDYVFKVVEHYQHFKALASDRRLAANP